MNNYNLQYNKLYKLSQSTILFLQSYYGHYGVCVGWEYSVALEISFGISISPHWINCTLKKSNIPVAGRGNRRRNRDKAECIKEIQLKVEKIGTHLFSQLYMPIIGNLISKVIKISNSYKIIDALSQIILSGDVKRISNYESNSLSIVDYSGKSLANSINKISNIPDINDRLNTELLNHFISEGINLDLIYADGHTKISYTGETSICGKISSSNRIAPGTKIVIINNKDGIILWFQAHRINEHLGQAFIDDTLKMNKAISEEVFLLKKSIQLIVDREGNGIENMQYASENGVEIITILNSKTYKSINDFELLPDSTDIYLWKGDKKFEDSRFFIRIPNKQNKLLFIALNKIHKLQSNDVPNIYKGRWNANENSLRELNQVLNFNTNTGQKIEYIDNPKVLEKHSKANKELPKLKERLILEEKKKPRKPHTIAKKENNINSYKNKIKKHEKSLEVSVNKVAIKDTKADTFIHILKGSIFNFVLMLLIKMKWDKINPQEAGSIVGLVFRREGYIVIEKNAIIYRFKEYKDKKKRERFRCFMEKFNQLKVVGCDGKLLIMEIFAQ